MSRKEQQQGTHRDLVAASREEPSGGLPTRAASMQAKKSQWESLYRRRQALRDAAESFYADEVGVRAYRAGNQLALAAQSVIDLFDDEDCVKELAIARKRYEEFANWIRPLVEGVREISSITKILEASGHSRTEEGERMEMAAEFEKFQSLFALKK